MANDIDIIDVPPQTALVVHSEPTPLALIAKMVESGQLTPESVSVVKELVALKEHMEDRQSENDFAVSFAAMQGELGVFQATKIVPGKDGKKRYAFAPYEEIMAGVKPLLQKFGFSVSFSTEFKDNRVCQTCTLQHISGHHRDYKAYTRVGSGPPGATESQADGAAMTYGKRYALCNALNITVEHDTDARMEGGPVTPEQAETLWRLVQESGANEQAFLKHAGACDYAEIGSNRYADLLESLERKLRQKK